jgi:hypothetical protein
MTHNHWPAARGWDGAARGSLGWLLASRFGQNRVGGGDHPEQWRGLGKWELTGRSRPSATEARAR